MTKDGVSDLRKGAAGGASQPASGASARALAEAGETLLAGYPGSALLVGRDGTVMAANVKGASLEALLQHGAAPEIPELIAQAVREEAVVVGNVTLAGTHGEVILEVMVAPRQGAEGLLVLARDLTMERNLRSALVESRQRYKDLVEVSSDFAWEVGADGRFTFVSPRGALGFRAEDMVGNKPGDYVVDADDDMPQPFLSDRAIENVEMWLRRADGSTACVVTSCLPLETDDGEWRGARGICRDITEEREREGALTRARHREQLLNYIVSTIRDELEPNNMLSTAAAAAARALGAAGCRIYRRNGDGAWKAAAKYGDREGIREADALVARLEDVTLEITLGPWRMMATATHYRQTVNGAICMWKKAEQGPWDDDNRILVGDVANQLGIAIEQIANHERIVKLSRTDGLTGLFNRRAFFEEELPRRLARLQRGGSTAALFYMDMDNFKRVNDVHGHQCGDDAILFLRDMLMDKSRPGDVIARLGGDEFAMWLDGIPVEVAIRRAEILIAASQSLAKFSGDDEHPLGLSVGVATFEASSGESLEDLLARADGAMYEAKHAGKGGYVIAPPARADVAQPGGEAST